MNAWWKLIAAMKRHQRRRERRVTELGPRYPDVVLSPECERRGSPVQRRVLSSLHLSDGPWPARGER